MNEKIQKIKEQCYIPVVTRYGDSEYDMEKFAELIVQECILLIQNEMQGEDQISSDFVYNKVVKPVKEHFGVE